MDIKSLTSNQELPLFNQELNKCNYIKWDEKTPFSRGTIVRHGDNLYESRINDNKGNNPVNSTSWISLL